MPCKYLIPHISQLFERLYIVALWKEMAAFFSPSTFLSHQISRTNYVFSSKQTPPNQPQPSQSQNPTPPQQLNTAAADTAKVQKQKRSTSSSVVESTDWIASSLTRRFGLGAGLAWAGFLAIGVLSEQIKTRFEVSQEVANTRDVEKEEEVVLPNGIRYYDQRVGGGASPRTGDLVVINVKGKVEGSDEAFVDTFRDGGKPLALVMGSRPYNRGICDGLDYVLRTMKAGGKRKVIIPPYLCFGEEGADLGSGLLVPPSATLEYIIQVEKVSIAPA